MPVFSDDFADPTPLPDVEATKVPTTQKAGQSPLDAQGEIQEPEYSTGSPADALHPERTKALALGKDPDKAKADAKAPEKASVGPEAKAKASDAQQTGK